MFILYTQPLICWLIHQYLFLQTWHKTLRPFPYPYHIYASPCQCFVCNWLHSIISWQADKLIQPLITTTRPKFNTLSNLSIQTQFISLHTQCNKNHNTKLTIQSSNWIEYLSPNKVAVMAKTYCSTCTQSYWKMKNCVQNGSCKEEA